jgi:hypothetical protein
MKKKMRTLAIAMAATVVTHSGFATNSAWNLSRYYLISGYTQPLPTGDYTGAPAQFAHNAMHDAQAYNPTWINANWVNSALSVSYQANSTGQNINNSSLKSYTLPDQIDGMDYFAHFTSDLACCIANTNYEIKNDYTVTASATWQPGSNPFTAQIGNGSVLTVQQTLRIAPGATLTINNMTLKFAPDARVIIERGNATQSGGRLILNGTTFTADNSCSENPMWLGVEVWGNPSLAQTLTHSQSKQGRLDMNNNSVIENARIGALASRRGTGNNLDNTHNGGLIRTENSTFRHNQTDVHLRRYGQTNLSRFVNTKFLLTQPLADINAWPQYRVYLLDVQGPVFEGCDFVNTAQVYAGQGTGLQCELSRFTVRARCTSVSLPCNSWDRGRVEGFRTGIYATAPAQNATRTAYIDRCDFIGNLLGVYFFNQKAPTLIRSQFTVPKVSNFSTIGLYMYRCDKYKIEENNFEEPAPVDALSGLTTYGAIVTESGTDHNEIYKNTFSELRVGIQAQGINGQADSVNNSWRGLQLLCNRFIKNIYQADMAVSSGRIDHQQGVAGQYSAGNEFSLNGYTPYNCIWINPNADDINYVHRSTAPHVPVYYDANKVFPTVYNGGPACPSKIKDAGGIVVGGMLVRMQEINELENPTDEEKLERREIAGDLLRAVNHMEEFNDSTDLVYTSLYGAAATKEQLLAKTDYLVSKGEYSPALNELYAKMSLYGFSTDLINMRVYAESEAAGFKITEEPINWHVYWAEALANAGVEYEAEGYALLEYLKNEGAFEPEIEPLWSVPDPKKGAAGNTPAIEAGKVYEVFPNPATDRLTVNIEGAYRAELHSATGGESATAILPEDGTWILPKNIAAGVYILRVYDQNGSLLHTQTVVKQ